MASGVEELLGMLYEMIEDAKSVPMHAEQCRLDRDRALDLLDEIRAQFPEELAQAQKIVNAREEYIASAKRDVENMRTQAQEQIKRMLSEDEVVRQAKEVANGMVKKAQEQSKELRMAASAYCDDALKRTEEAVNAAMSEVRQARGQFRQLAGRSAAYDPESEQ